jgi:hypothetical protein
MDLVETVQRLMRLRDEDNIEPDAENHVISEPTHSVTVKIDVDNGVLDIVCNDCDWWNHQ